MMNNRFCIYCGTKIASDAVFCHACGKRQSAIDEVENAPQKIDLPEEPCPSCVSEIQAVAAQKPAKQPYKLSIPNIIRNSIILLVALAMMIFAFLPVLDLETEYSNVEIDIKLSAVDQIVVLFDSFKNLDAEELLETDLAEKAQDLYEFIFDSSISDVDDLSDSEERKLAKLCLLLLRMNAQSEDFTAPAVYYISAVFSIIYITNAIALFVFALLNLLASLGLLGGAEKSMLKWTTRALTLTPVLLITTFFAIYVAMCESIAPGMNDMAIGTLVMSLSTIIMMFVLRMIFTKRDQKLRPVARAIAATLAIVVICLSFAPVLNASVSTVFSGSQKTRTATIEMSASFFTVHHVSESTKEQLEDQFDDYTTAQKVQNLSDIFEQFKNFTKKDAEGMPGASINNTLLINLLGSKAPGSVLELVSLIGILFIGALVGAALILWQNASYFANGLYSTKVVVTGKVISGVFSLLALATSIVYLVVMRNLGEIYLPSQYELSISAGVICLAIFAVGSIFCPHKIRTRVTKTEEIANTDPGEAITIEQ